MTKPQKLCKEIVRLIVTSDNTQLKDLHSGKLAQDYDLTQPYLTRIFRECEGISLREFIKRVKLLRIALLMLENRNLKVWKIAEYFGFDSVDSFTKNFKNFFNGITPGKFKKCTR
jgi:AraC-like DNA-binding protein